MKKFAILTCIMILALLSSSLFAASPGTWNKGGQIVENGDRNPGPSQYRNINAKMWSLAITSCTTSSGYITIVPGVANKSIRILWASYFVPSRTTGTATVFQTYTGNDPLRLAAFFDLPTSAVQGVGYVRNQTWFCNLTCQAGATFGGIFTGSFYGESKINAYGEYVLDDTQNP